jgi:DNA invertase Pin-like site-specific DNA recombinase
MTGDRQSTIQLRSSKLRPWHLDRLAVVYVRQSSAQQVADNCESTARQYALADRAEELGWLRSRVLVIDDDQGKSGSSVEGRLGFQRLLAEVGLDHVGLILGLEMSRLARSCKDWHQLLELCAMFRTLLADQDGVYDPTDPNDRLLLGLKGTMSEAELHVLRGRLRQGLLNKARRGAVFVMAPVGYVRSSDGGFELDPDEQVRGVVQMIFDQFERLGSARMVVKTLIEQNVTIGFRIRSGPSRGQVEWRPIAPATIANILRHPVYAGVYAFGRTQADPRRRTACGQTARKRVGAEQYVALLPDALPAYISHEQYEKNQRRLADNRSRYQNKGAPREGSSLLAGIVHCGRCGRRMVVSYCGSNRRLRYACSTRPDVRVACTQHFGGDVLDQLVAEQVLIALQPGALELSLAAAQDVIREREALDRNWRQRLERVRAESKRAERQYHAVEPENRLVARTLERRWEDALHAERAMEEDYARFRQSQPATPTGADLERIRALAQDLPAVWNASTTKPVDRQRIIRILVEGVEATAESGNDRLHVKIQWAGGSTTEHEILRRVKLYERQSAFPKLQARVRELYEAGLTYQAIADQLNEEGFRPAYIEQGFLKKNVGAFIRKHVDQNGRSKQRTPLHYQKLLRTHEWLPTDLARRIGIGKTTIYSWMTSGRIEYRRVPYARPLFACFADDGEIERLTELAKTPRKWYDPPLPERLTTPRSTRRTRR